MALSQKVGMLQFERRIG